MDSRKTKSVDPIFFVGFELYEIKTNTKFFAMYLNICWSYNWKWRSTMETMLHKIEV